MSGHDIRHGPIRGAPGARMVPSRLFTLEEANSLVPTLDRLVGRQILRQAEIEQRLRTLAGVTGSIACDLEIAEGDDGALRELKSDILERLAAYEEGWQEVTALGAVVKDTQAGAIDFYGRMHGRAVWLSWLYGEERVDHFREMDAAMDCRKPLDRKTRQKLLN
jgi:hypothetical protein